MSVAHTDRAASSDLDPAESPERHGEGCDSSRHDIADDHDLGRIGGN